MLGLLHPLLLSDVVLFVFSSYRISHLEEEDDEAFLVSSSAHYCWVNKCNCSETVPSQMTNPSSPCCSHFLTWSSAFCHKKVSICLAFHFLWRIKVPSRLVPPP